MILAFHSIFGAYGFWLPNEPRGSWSDFVASWDLYYYGPATRVHTRRSIAHRPYDRALKKQMQTALTHPPVRFTGRQALTIARAIGAAGYTLHALAVMPNHVHAVIAYTPREIRRVVGHLKSESTRALRAHGWFLGRRPWCDHGWNVYLDSDQAVTRAVRYVQNNPLRDGLRPQRWSFVRSYGARPAQSSRTFMIYDRSDGFQECPKQ